MLATFLFHITQKLIICRGNEQIYYIELRTLYIKNKKLR